MKMSVITRQAHSPASKEEDGPKAESLTSSPIQLVLEVYGQSMLQLLITTSTLAFDSIEEQLSAHTLASTEVAGVHLKLGIAMVELTTYL